MKNWKELKKQFWAKLIAMLLAIVSGFVFVVTAAATLDHIDPWLLLYSHSTALS